MNLRHLVALLLTLSIAAAEEVRSTDTAAARFELARAHLHGDGMPKNPKKAFELMSEAAEDNHPDAIGGLGYFYSTGIAVPKDEAKAEDCFRKGAELGSAKSRLNYGQILLKKNPAAVVDGLAWIKKAADQRLPEAALAYGKIFYFGDHGQAKDHQAAAAYLIVAAEDGSAEAQNMIGAIMEGGSDVAEDKTAAINWYRNAALQGHLKAQSNLGRALNPLSDESEGVEALAWLIIAEASGEIMAKHSLIDAMPAIKPEQMQAARALAEELRGKIQR